MSDHELLQSNPAELAQLFESSLNEIYIFDAASLRFAMVNRPARDNLGYTLAELRTMTPLDLKPEFTRESFEAMVQPLRDGERDKLLFETVHLRKDGTTYPVEVHLQPGEYCGARVLNAIILDITERRRAEEERRQFDSQFLEAQKLESLGVLAGGIAHDFNNILTSIMGYADLARLSCTPESDTYRYITEMLRGAKRGADLIKQLLAYSGKGRFIIERIHLPDLVDDIRNLLEVTISRKCTLQFYFENDIPPVDADGTQIRQVILNLIMNASEALQDLSGMIIVRVGAQQADRRYLSDTFLDDNLPEGQYVTLEISDSGVGMDEATLRRIFEPFYTTKFTGRGLGLAAVMGIVRGHRGAIRVYSEPGRGTTFKILLPAAPDSRPPRVAPPVALPDWHCEGLALVVDDEAQVRVLATEMLQRIGFSCLVAEDGVSGLATFCSHHHELRLVILDMTMPRLDGAGTYREMRRINDGIPTILSSGYNEQATINQFAGKGLAGFLQKPYTYHQLLAAVRKAVERPARA